MTAVYRCHHDGCGFEVSAEDGEELVETAKRHEADQHDDVLQRVAVERRIDSA